MEGISHLSRRQSSILILREKCLCCIADIEDISSKFIMNKGVCKSSRSVVYSKCSAAVEEHSQESCESAFGG